MPKIFILISMIFWVFGINAKTLYYTYLNDFANFKNSQSTTLNGNYLRTENTTSDNLICIDSLQQDCAYTFCYNLRLANRHAAEGKRYAYFDTSSGAKKKISATECGAVWNYSDGGNYFAVLLSCANSNLHDILDKRYMSIKVVKVSSGVQSVIKELAISDWVDLGTDFNMIRIAYDGSATTIAIGNKGLKIVAEIHDIDYSHNMNFGYIVGKGACVDVERMVLYASMSNKNALQTKWNEHSILEHISKSSDSYEGVWSYLDRKLDETHLKLGGKYDIALIKNGKDYDIIYLSGSKVNDTEWSCGMLKGKLKHTIFTDNYDLIWYDALKRPFNDDEFATFESESVLTMRFPTQNGTIRFYKKPKDAEK